MSANKKIKILYVITQDEWGGAQQYIFDLALYFGDIFDITIVTGTKVSDGLYNRILQSQELDPTKFRNVNCQQLNCLVRPISLKNDRLAVIELAKLITKIKPDILHLNSSKASIIGTWAVKKLTKNERPKVVYTVHGWVFNEPMNALKRWFYRWLEKTAAKYKDAIIVLSEADKKIGIELGLKEKLEIIPHGLVNIELWARDRAKNLLRENYPEIPSNTTCFVTIANAYKTKGLDNLLLAIAQKRERLTKVSFVIIGAGPELDTLKKLKNKMKLVNVFFCDFIPLARAFLPAFDVFVLPSRKEGLPYAILEALYAKVPIIATRVGGISSLIENKKSGLLVKPDSVDELANTLVYAVEHPEEMKKFAENAPAPIPLSVMVEQTKALYRRLLAEPR